MKSLKVAVALLVLSVTLPSTAAAQGGYFGGIHYALASYNAGDGRVAAWIKESPDLAPDEFIDSIPFPETQNYVKRILGTAEDYRRLYGTGLLTPNRRPLTD